MENAEKLIKEGMAAGAVEGAALMQKIQIQTILDLQIRILARLEGIDDQQLNTDIKAIVFEQFNEQWLAKRGLAPEK